MDSYSEEGPKKWPTFSKLGNCYCIFYNNSPFILIGPHWTFNVCALTLILIIISAYLTYLVPKMEYYSSITGTLILFTSLISYITVSLANPGVILPDSNTDVYPYLLADTVCPTCKVFINKSIRHCEDCNLCFKQLDHHCIFMGKCIASRNLLSFYTFLTSVFAFFVFSMFFVFTVDINR